MTEEGLLLDLGVRGYEEVWKLQRELVERRLQGAINDALVLVEHPPVYTLGRRTPEGAEVPQGVPHFRVERGGDITFHGPGQLVGYPIVKLDDRGMDVKGYVHSLEEVIIAALPKFGLRAHRGSQTGVWVGERKVASIGVAVRHWITFHGFALNVNVDLEYFRRIKPCGLEGATITSMGELLGHRVYMEALKKEIVDHFQGVFGLNLQAVGLDLMHVL